jgi:hypothetical protein
MSVSSFRLSFSILALICGLLTASATFAQTSSSEGTTAKKTFRESAGARRKAIEDQERRRQERVKEAERKQIATMEARNRKKAECSRQAKARKLHLLKRRSFMKKCMAG